MKKQQKIITGTVLGIAAVILLISFLFPTVYKGLTTGSFGKAEKYRQDQMSEADIQLRTDFVKDTANLRKMVTGLIYFSLFTENLAMTIDTCVESYRFQGIDKDPASKKIITMLGDYSTFLTNNSKTVAGTTRMLAALLLNDTSAASMDIEKNVRDFALFVNQVNEKDSLLMTAIACCDQFLVGNKTLQKNTEQVRNLKAIRDQLVIKSTQFLAMTGNKPALGSMLNYVVSSQDQFSAIKALNIVQEGAVEKVSVRAADQLGIGTIGSKALQAGFSAAQLNTNLQSKELNVLVYSKDQLHFYIRSGAQLSGMVNANTYQSMMNGMDVKQGVLCVSYPGNLGVIYNAGVLCNAYSSSFVNSALSAQTLNMMLPAKELFQVRSNDMNAVGLSASLQIGYGGNVNLSSFANSNEVLKGMISSGGGVVGSFANFVEMSALFQGQYR